MSDNTPRIRAVSGCVVLDASPIVEIVVETYTTTTVSMSPRKARRLARRLYIAAKAAETLALVPEPE